LGRPSAAITDRGLLRLKPHRCAGAVAWWKAGGGAHYGKRYIRCSRRGKVRSHCSLTSPRKACPAPGRLASVDISRPAILRSDRGRWLRV